MWADREDDAQAEGRRSLLRSPPLVEGGTGPSGGAREGGTTKNVRAPLPRRAGWNLVKAGEAPREIPPFIWRRYAIRRGGCDGVTLPKWQRDEVQRQTRRRKSARGVRFHHHFWRQLLLLLEAVGSGGIGPRTVLHGPSPFFRFSELPQDRHISWFLVLRAKRVLSGRDVCRL